jgi:hypothetical protein
MKEPLTQKRASGSFNFVGQGDDATLSIMGS